METIIDRTVAAAGRYEGSGKSVENGEFSATLDIVPLLDGLGAELVYTATSGDGDVLHAERTTLAFDMWSGEATLFVLCSELSGIGQLRQSASSTFSNGRGKNGFELQVEMIIEGDSITYVWSWGRPDEELAEQTRAKLKRTG